MSAPVFFRTEKPLTLGEIATLVGATPPDASAAARLVRDIAPLDLAGPDDLTFLDRAKLAPQARITAAGACLVGKRLAEHVPEHCVALVVDEPYRAFVVVARAMFPDSLRPSSLYGVTGVSPGAHVHETARLEAGVTLDPGVAVGPYAEIGAGTVVCAQAVIGPAVRIGRQCSIGPGATVMNALVGDRVTVHAGARIGQDGFGYVMGAKHLKVPQTGRVILQDDVEIGANTTIDRGASRDTMIGEGSKIDNLCQIAHNVIVGRHCIMASYCGISGSAVIEDYVIMGGRVGVIDHVTVGTGAMIAAGSGVLSDVARGAKMGGLPAMPLRDWIRSSVLMQKLVHQNAKQQDRDEPETGGRV